MKPISVDERQAKRLISNLHAAAQGKPPTRGRLVAGTAPVRVKRGPTVATVNDIAWFLEAALAQEGDTP